MYHSTRLSVPDAFAREHQHLHLTADTGRPQPTGSCQFLLINPSAKSRICACQIYHHNRGAPGDVCDCGHSACYHTPDQSQSPSSDWAEKVKRLEDMILAERDARDRTLAQERSHWEQEIRTLRVALDNAYKTEAEMHRKLLEVEDKLDSTVDMQYRLRDRMGSLDDAHMAMEKRMGAAPVSFPGTNHHLHHGSPNTADDVPGLTSSDDRSSSSSFSRHQTPSEINAATSTTSVTGIDPESPRSSGILNLVSLPRPPVPPYVTPRRPTPTRDEREEPRSSGFLGVDLKEQIKLNMVKKQQNGTHRDVASVSPYSQPSSHRLHPYQNGSQQTWSSTTPTTISTPMTSDSIRHSTPRSLPRPSPPVNGYISADHHLMHDSKISRKRKHISSTAVGLPDMMALDVLANVSAASPVIH